MELRLALSGDCCGCGCNCSMCRFRRLGSLLLLLRRRDLGRVRVDDLRMGSVLIAVMAVVGCARRVCRHHISHSLDIEVVFGILMVVVLRWLS